MMPVSYYDELGKPVRKGYIPAEVIKLEEGSVLLKEIESEKVWAVNRPTLTRHD